MSTQEPLTAETVANIWADMQTDIERCISETALDITDPIQFGAEEYWCAMKRLDALGVQREHDGETLSLVGRIDKATGTLESY
jgi:hypothetical protein